MDDDLIIEFALKDWIESLPVCAAQGTKCYPWARAPQTTAVKPFVLYHRVSGGRLRSLAGPSGVSHPRIQLDVIGRDVVAVRRTASYIRKQLEALEAGGDMAGKTVQVAIAGDGDRDADDADPDQYPKHGGEDAEHRAILEVTIWFVEG